MSDAAASGPNGLPGEDLEDLYENAPCGYLSLQPDGRIFKVNRTFSAWMGYSQAELVGKRLRDLLNIAGRIFYETHFAPLLRMQGFFNEVALDLVTSDGRPVPVLVNAVERKDPAGRLLFIRLTVFNATDRRRYERELLSARAKADDARQALEHLNALLEAKGAQAVAEHLRAERELVESHAHEAAMQISLQRAREEAKLREQFMAVLGHDLRNPLAAIAAGTRLLQRQPLNEKSLGIVVMMQSTVQRMAKLIDNVLDFARGSLGGGLTLNKTTAPPIEVALRQVLDEFRSATPDRQFDAEFSISDDINCDHSRIAQLLSNFLGNAVSHGAAGEPIRLRATTRDGVFELSVANAGPAIPPATLERLFQPFVRGEVRSNHQGLGLGLYIASEIAHAHGGDIHVSSTPAETIFQMTMPVRDGEGTVCAVRR